MLLPFTVVTAATSVTLATAKNQSKVDMKVAKRHVRHGQRIVVAGQVRPARAGRPVQIQVKRGHGWHRVDTVRTGRKGRFTATWRPRRLGSYLVRASFGGDALSGPGRRTLKRAVNVYRSVLASWYGPGFYGGHLACGGRLRPGTMGVANKTLPCGTKVTLYRRGRSVRVPVIDRGPYSGGREYDLTGATAKRLRFAGVGRVMATR